MEAAIHFRIRTRSLFLKVSKTDAQEWMDYLADEIGQNDGTGRGLRVDVGSSWHGH